MFSYFIDHSAEKPLGSLSIAELHRQIVQPDIPVFVKSIKTIQRLRAEPDEAKQKLIKNELPAIMPGAMVDSRAEKATAEQKNIRLSGYIQIDIDQKDNVNMRDAGLIRDKLAQIPYIELAAISARGRGVWGLMALQRPERLRDYVEQIQKYFSDARVTLDKGKSKSPTELRYYSPDPGAYLNPKPLLFPLMPYHSIRRNDSATVSHAPTALDKARTEALIRELEDIPTDITGSYPQWFEIGCSLANTFGADGREYYHDISQYYPDYSPEGTDRQFNRCLKSKASKEPIQLNTLFHYAKLAGVIIDSPANDFR